MEVISHANAAYGLTSKVGEVHVYESVPQQRSILPQDNKEKDLDPATGKKVSVKGKKVRVKCYVLVTILALVIAVLSLIVALVGVSFASVELINQQTQLSNSNQQIQILFQADRNLTEILQLHVGTVSHPVSSCSEIPQYKPSGEYWIATNSTSSPVQVYCDMNPTSCSCSTAGGWMRVVNLDMTDSNQKCPDGFRLVNSTTPPLRTCGRPGPAGCVSTAYPTYGVEYSRVCGRVIGYQDKTPDAFDPYFDNRTLSIDDVYVDGVSVTHGQSPRQHIWTFANAHDEAHSNHWVCPCTRPDLIYAGVVPPFIGQNYFCETGSRQAASYIFYPDDPLWDGHGCASDSTCCEFNSPPWFCKQLPQSTKDDIELRICGNENIENEDILLQLVDIYIH
ncbi:uncharacterized protein LOC135346471 [Halichondria panicea]|uniref:uncharacterized protein LOC135346471 n=1 Tax=Halichondria panicea TaxID=6063 RepID=UPI00312B3359